MTKTITLASPLKRLGAYLLDSFFLMCPFLTTLFFFGYLRGFGRNGMDPALRMKVQILMGCFMIGYMLIWTFYNCLWLYRDGQTLGKKMLNIKTIRTTGERAGLRRLVFLRGGSTALIGFVPFGSLIDHLMIFGENNQTLHDRVADTFVVDA